MRRAPTAALAAALALAACAAEPEPTEQVLVRIEQIEVAGAAARAEPLKLGTETRRALRVPAASTFEIEVPDAARALLFSRAACGGGGVRQRVGLLTGGGESTLFEGETPAEPVAWSDHEVALDASVRASADAPRRLRFRSEGEADAACWGSLRLLGPETDMAPRPNVVLLSLDTLAAPYLSAFDNVPGVSPRIDGFLRDGFSFRRAYAQYGNTLVSHSSLFSGLYPRNHGRYPNGRFQPFRSLVESLAADGFLTAAFTEGAFVASNWGFSRGFDRYDDGAIGLANQMAGGAERTFDRATRWLERTGRQRRFFLFVHTYEVHAPYQLRSPGEEAIVARITPGDDRRFPDKAQARAHREHNAGRRRLSPRDLDHLRALHSAEIHRLDRLVGAFLARLAELGLADRTLVVLTSDHGDQFGEWSKVGHGESLHNRVLHVPLAFRWTGHIQPGASDAPVQLVDVLPTVLDLVGVEAPAALDGTSLAPWLRGETPPARPAFSEQRTAPGECAVLGQPGGCRLERYAVQTERFKLVTSELPRWARLYDLAADPLETRDVAAQHPDELARHRALLDAYLAAPVGAASGDPGPAIDAQTLRQLRALGYATPVAPDAPEAPPDARPRGAPDAGSAEPPGIR